jgi:enoyl-CoA hydratase/carnithine racemase
MSRLLERSQEGGVLRLTLNDPETRNSLSEEMLEALGAALNTAREDTTLRVIVVAANGPVFSSGHNLKELTAHRNDTDRGRNYFAHVFSWCSGIMQRIVNHPLPVIAEVQGLASAAGCQLVASCDLAVASEHATFCTPGVNIGLFCSTPMVALSRTVLPKQAKEMLFTGDTIDARDAERIGLVNRVVPERELTFETITLAKKIAAKARSTIVTGKQAYNSQTGFDLTQAYAAMAETMMENLLREDAKEGIAAFLEKRSPVWPEPG